jgi:alkylation response protein AidB-like acyl-CoA dehydrogenase
MAQDARGCPDELWKRMAELGWIGLALPEAHGGAGLGLVELAVLLEEMGRVLAPVPFLSTVLLGAGAIAQGGSEEQKRRLLPELARGRARATLALLEGEERWDAEAVQLPLRRERGRLSLSGTKRFVPDAQVADWLVVAARDPSAQLALVLVDARASGVELRPTATVDGTRKLAELRLDDVAVAADALLPGGASALARVLDRARVGLCAEMLGGAERVLQMSVAYAKSREQFGRPIGSFQAIQHRCADMLVALESARSATWYAAWALETEAPDADVAAAIAKALLSEAGPRIAGDGIQIHGGLGFTWEQDLHLYYRRALVSARLFGDAAWNRERIACRRIDGAS